ncbi:MULTISPECIES: hypothetical protein [unclassified Sphingomonas]|nr:MULTISPECIES: hypothetical protein [unclassified Sphingomonas]
MIDNFSLGLTHFLMLLAVWHLLRRDDLDREGEPVRVGVKRGKRPGA